MTIQIWRLVCYESSRASVCVRVRVYSWVSEALGLQSNTIPVKQQQQQQPARWEKMRARESLCHVSCTSFCRAQLPSPFITPPRHNTIPLHASRPPPVRDFLIYRYSPFVLCVARLCSFHIRNFRKQVYTYIDKVSFTLILFFFRWGGKIIY